MTTHRLAFKFFKSYMDVANELSDKDRLAFYDAVINKQFFGIEPILNGMAKFAYISQKHNIDSQVKGYEDKSGIKLTPTQGGAQGGTQDPLLQEKEKAKEKEKDMFNFKSELLKLAENKDLVEDWLRVRKTKKATNTKTALNSFLSEIEKSGMSVDYVLYMCVNKSWSGFNAEWIKSDSITPKSNIAKSILEGDTGW